jgi:hypothetical protein
VAVITPSQIKTSIGASPMPVVALENPPEIGSPGLGSNQNSTPLRHDIEAAGQSTGRYGRLERHGLLFCAKLL